MGSELRGKRACLPLKNGHVPERKHHIFLKKNQSEAYQEKVIPILIIPILNFLMIYLTLLYFMSLKRYKTYLLPKKTGFLGLQTL